jgi:hypothetical protein
MAIPTAQVTRRRYGAGKLWAAPAGTLTVAAPFAPASITAGAFIQGTDALTKVPGSTTFLPLGVTEDGMEFSFGFDTEDDESAEYYYPLKTVVTGQTASMSATLKQVNLTNLRLALNASTSAVTGTPSATAAAKLTPPLPGAEVRCQILWESLDNDIVIIGYSALQTNEVTLSPNKGAAGLSLDLQWNLEQPAATIATVPFDIWVTGTSWVETVSGD